MIFCFEEDTAIRELMLSALEQSELVAKGFKSGFELFSALRCARPGLVIADIMCERENGGAILNELREISVQMGFKLLIIAANWMEGNRLSGIELGNENVLLKPFNITRLMQAVNKTLHPDAADADRILKFGNLIFNTQENRVTVNGEIKTLTRKEYELLRIFMDNTEQVFSREQLFNLVWKSAYMGESRTVDVHIGRLRSKLGEAGKHIKTVHCSGYCMSEIG